MSVFYCKHQWKNGEIEEWSGEISRIISYGSHYEIFIQSRSSILILIAQTSYGLFVGIPTFKGGCFISNLKDLFFNKEILIEVLKNTVDGITVACALKSISEKLSFN